MTFLHPALLFAAVGVALPILAHLLNRHEVKKTDWAAMQFLNRNVRVRSRQLKLRDLLLLALRCLALLFLLLALAQPSADNPGGPGQSFGERRGGVIIAIDASYGMGHSDGQATRFQRAKDKARAILADLHPGDPVSLVLLGAEHSVVARNVAYDATRFEGILEGVVAVPESLDLNEVPSLLERLAMEMQAPQKEIYLISDFQAKDWEAQPQWLLDAFADMGKGTPTVFAPVIGEPDNLAVTGLELVSGVLRKGTIARYQATVRNYGTSPAMDVRVKGLADNVIVDTKSIPTIAPGESGTVSLFVHFHNAGAVKIRAELEEDPLPADNARHTVAIVRDTISVLCVVGGPGSGGTSANFVQTALQARGDNGEEENFQLQTMPWTDLPNQDFEKFDVIVLQGVPDIAREQALAIEEYVRKGNGLIWFPGDKLDADAWNEHSAREGVTLLPAILGDKLGTSDALGVGRPLDPSIPDHAVCRPLHSLPEDLLGETRFLSVLQVDPAPTSSTVLSLAGTASPLLLEHSLGRGHVFLFTTSADPAWNNLALTPVFPMLLQQMLTYLTAREFEKPRLVGHSLSLSYIDRPDASEAVFDTPSGESISVPVREHRNQHVAFLDHAREAGVYLARVSIQAPGVPVAVNIDTKESDVSCLPPEAFGRIWEGTDVHLALTDEDLQSKVAQLRTQWSFWPSLLLAGLVLLLVESLMATMMRKSAASSKQPQVSSTQPESA
jgi:hypothetical protein